MKSNEVLHFRSSSRSIAVAQEIMFNAREFKLFRNEFTSQFVCVFVFRVRFFFLWILHKTHMFMKANKGVMCEEDLGVDFHFFFLFEFFSLSCVQQRCEVAWWKSEQTQGWDFNKTQLLDYFLLNNNEGRSKISKILFWYFLLEKIINQNEKLRDDKQNKNKHEQNFTSIKDKKKMKIFPQLLRKKMKKKTRHIPILPDSYAIIRNKKGTRKEVNSIIKCMWMEWPYSDWGR